MYLFWSEEAGLISGSRYVYPSTSTGYVLYYCRTEVPWLIQSRDERWMILLPYRRLIHTYSVHISPFIHWLLEEILIIVPARDFICIDGLGILSNISPLFPYYPYFSIDNRSSARLYKMSFWHPSLQGCWQLYARKAFGNVRLKQSFTYSICCMGVHYWCDGGKWEEYFDFTGNSTKYGLEEDDDWYWW